MRSLKDSAAIVAAALAMAAASSMPPLGQQTRLTPRRAFPGEVLRPPKPKVKRVLTPNDIKRIEAAAARRERRQARNLQLAARGAIALIGSPS